MTDTIEVYQIGECEQDKYLRKQIEDKGFKLKVYHVFSGVADWVPTPFIKDHNGFRHFGREGIEDFITKNEAN